MGSPPSWPRRAKPLVTAKVRARVQNGARSLGCTSSLNGTAGEGGWQARGGENGLPAQKPFTKASTWLRTGGRVEREEEGREQEKG